MPATISRRAVRLTVSVVLVFLAGGCAGNKTASAPARRAARPPARTVTPLSAAELAWITAVTNLHHKIDKPFQASSITMTRAKMTELGNALRA